MLDLINSLTVEMCHQGYTTQHARARENTCTYLLKPVMTKTRNASPSYMSLQVICEEMKCI